MKEKAPALTVYPPASSSSPSLDDTVDEETHSENLQALESLSKFSFTSGSDSKLDVKPRKIIKKVKFTASPKYKSKRSTTRYVPGRKPRAALQALQSHSSNPKLLVGSGSPRPTAIGKPKKGHNLKQRQLVITCTSSPTSLSSDGDDTADTTLNASDVPIGVGSNEVWSGAPIRVDGGEVSGGSTSCREDEKSVFSIGIQTEDTATSSSADYKMCTEKTPTEDYWRVLAEQRREALAETLQENEELHTEIKKLKAHISQLENRVQDTNYFAMMYKLASSNDSQQTN